MPGTPPVTPNFGAPRLDANDDFDIVGDFNAAVDAFDARAALRALLPPVGTQMPYVGTADPPAVDGVSAWLICDGRDVNSADYPALDALIGAAAAVGAGRHRYNGGTSPAAGKFRLPNKQGRVSVASGTPTGARGATAKTAGDKGGEETTQLAITHIPGHSHATPDHQHGLPYTPLSPSGTHYAFATTAGAEVAMQTNLTNPGGGGTTSLTGGGADHNNLPPYEVDGGYIIRAL